MSVQRIVQDWPACVSTQLLPAMHKTQAKALADFSYAAVLAGSCQASRLPLHVPTAATPASSQRRCERLLANLRLTPRRAQESLASDLLKHWYGQNILLMLDETPKANDLRVLTIRVVYRERARH